MPTSPAIHQISHQVSLDPYHLHMPWMNIHFLWVFKEHDVLTQKEIERFQDAVQIDQHLIIWPIAIKGDLEKTIRTNCIYHCSSANIISQLFCQKNTFHWKQNQDLPSYFTFSLKCLFIVVYSYTVKLCFRSAKPSCCLSLTPIDAIWSHELLFAPYR